MTNNNNLKGRIASIHQDLSPKHKTLARFLMDNRIFVSFASAEQVGEKAGTSAATVVRFAQTLGYTGFSALQASLREEIPTYLTAIERIQKRLSSPSTTDTIPQHVFQTDIRNIERTARLLSPEILERATRDIVQADRILVLGTGLSAAPALYLSHSLRVIGYETHVSTDGGLSLAAEIAAINKGVLLITIGLWRYAQSSVDAAHIARRNGARTIAITDSALSPLTKDADHVFEVATDRVAHSLSATALVSLLNVFIASLSELQPERTMRSLQRVDAAYRDFKLISLE
jgi:DNA-binding MurR/RpiR family transcriptional regulator